MMLGKLLKKFKMKPQDKTFGYKVEVSFHIFSFADTEKEALEEVRKNLKIRNNLKNFNLKLKTRMERV